LGQVYDERKDFHLRQRRMIQPAFHRQRIAGYAESMIEFAERMASEWRDGEVRDVDKEMMRLTLNIVGKTLFGANVEDDATEVGEAMTTIVSMFNLLLLPFAELLEKLPLPHTRKFNKAKETLDEVIYKIIDDAENPVRYGRFALDALKRAGRRKRRADVGRANPRRMYDDFLAGHETTATL
jgi:cytochrome P450